MLQISDGSGPVLARCLQKMCGCARSESSIKLFSGFIENTPMPRSPSGSPPPRRRSRSRSRSHSPKRKSDRDRSYRGGGSYQRRSRSPAHKGQSPGRRTGSPRRRDSRSPQRIRRSPNRSRSRDRNAERGLPRQRWDDEDRGRGGDRRQHSRWNEDRGRTRESNPESNRNRPSDSRPFERSSVREGGGGAGPRTFIPPAIYSLHKGKVVRIADFGCFVDIEGAGNKSKWGLVHVSQMLPKVKYYDII